MNLQETTLLFAILTTAYPRFEQYQDKEKLKLAIQLWSEMLKDVPYPIAELAAKKLISESPYPPVISDMRKHIAEISKPNIQNAAEAWGEVTSCIKKYGSYREIDSLQEMSPLTAKVVKMIGYREICLSDEPGVVRGQFTKMYEQIANREKQENLLPDTLKQQIKLVSSNLKMLKEGA